MRLETQHSALNAGIVNNQRTLIWDFGAVLSHEVFRSPRRTHLHADPLCAERFAERAITPGEHAGGPEAWDKVRLFPRNSSVCTWCKRRGETRREVLHRERRGR